MYSLAPAWIAAGVGRGPAGDHRHRDVFGFKPRDQIADVDRNLDHQEIGAAPGAQHAQCHLGAIRMGDGRAFFHGELGGERELAVESADDQEAHVSDSLFLVTGRAKRVGNGE
jgi:hypothetical protein